MIVHLSMSQMRPDLQNLQARKKARKVANT